MGNGKKVTSSASSLVGPNTTISESGSDCVVLAQGDLVHDTTSYGKSRLLGARDILSVSQGFGFSFFNCFTASMTRFIPVNPFIMFGKSIPASLVLHGKFGNSIGDIASYDYFTLGGPFSCRGFNIGELGSARRFIELGAEARLPTPLINGQIFSFFEHANSMGSSQDLAGNPNEFYRHSGKGSSWGYGLKVGALRFEYARDCNLGKGSFFARFGERY